MEVHPLPRNGRFVLGKPGNFDDRTIRRNLVGSVKISLFMPQNIY
jgi:hypothetical protein